MTKLSMTKSMFASAALLVCASACGTGNEPFGVLGNNLANGPQTIPSLALPLVDSTAVWNSVISYNTSGVQVDGFEFVMLQPSQTLVAPAEGLVYAVSSDASSGQTLSTVTIAHSARLMTRISKIQGVTVQIGQFVAQGSSLGISATTLSATVYPRLSVLLDGATVCPYSYFTSSARHSFQTSRTFVSSLQPCIE